MTDARSAPRSPGRPHGAASLDWRVAAPALGPLLALLAVMSVLPFLVLLWLSVSDFSFSLPGRDGAFVGLRNYAEALGDPRFHASLRLQLLFMLCTIPVELLLGLGGALAIWRWGRVSSLGIVLIALPMILAPVTVGMIWRLLLHGDYGPIGFLLSRVLSPDQSSLLGSPALAFAALAGVDVWQWTPFCLIALLAALHRLPRLPHLAAEADGATSLQVLWTVTLPLLRPAILIVLILRVMDSFKEYDKIFVLTRGGPASATELASPFIWIVSFDHGDLAYGAAVTVLLYLAIYGLCALLLPLARTAGRP